MFTIKTISKKVLLAVLVLAFGLGALPMMDVHAASPTDETEPPESNLQPDNSRLEAIWARELTRYEKAVNILDKADEMISRVQTLISKANEKGWDTSPVQAALEAFETNLRDARPIINSANGIVTSHKGFDANGKVTDRAQAIESVKELGQHLQEARAAMGGSGKALREAVKALRAAHQPAPSNP